MQRVALLIFCGLVVAALLVVSAMWRRRGRPGEAASDDEPAARAEPQPVGPNYLVDLVALANAGATTPVPDRPCKKCGGGTYYAVEWQRHRCRTCHLYQ